VNLEDQAKLTTSFTVNVDSNLILDPLIYLTIVLVIYTTQHLKVSFQSTFHYQKTESVIEFKFLNTERRSSYWLGINVKGTKFRKISNIVIT
jgi:hypothetical protein